MRTSWFLRCVRAGCGLTVTFFPNRFGTGAFDYDFGALDEKKNQLTESYMNVMYDHHWTSAVQEPCHADHSSFSLAMRASGFPPDYSSS